MHIKVPAEGQHTLAFDLVAEHRDGHQISLQRQLVPREQGARGRREISAACLAAPARLVLRAAAVVTDLAAAMRTDWLAIGLWPAQPHKYVLRASLGHPHDLTRAERAGGRGQQEVLRHQGRVILKNIQGT